MECMASLQPQTNWCPLAPIFKLITEPSPCPASRPTPLFTPHTIPALHLALHTSPHTSPHPPHLAARSPAT